MAVSQHFMAWVCSKQLNNLFLYHLLQLKKPEFERVAVGSTIKTIGLGYFAKLCIPLPPISEQIFIVETLDAANTTICAVENLIEVKVRYKRALTEQLLSGKRRFAEFKGQEWREAKLTEFLAEKSERCPVTETPVVLSCSKLYGILLQSDRFSKQLASRDLRRYKFVEPGNLVFDPMLLWDASIAFSELRGVVSPAYYTLRFISEQADRRFFHYTNGASKPRYGLSLLRWRNLRFSCAVSISSLHSHDALQL